MEEYRKANLALWNQWTLIRIETDFFNLEGFKRGQNTLYTFELDEVGDVRGKSMLHLQCHVGLDSLSWARQGARVTGVDFSDQALKLAEGLRVELEEAEGLQGEFLCADIYDLPEVLDQTFDIVYSAKGVLAWLPDLTSWAEMAAHFLKPGGIFYLAEVHPFSAVFDDGEEVTRLQVAYPYFHSPQPLVSDVVGFSELSDEVTQRVSYEWVHSLSDVVNALLGAGLQIEFVHEFPFSVYPIFPAMMEQGEDGLWRLRDRNGFVPLMFSVRARKPA